MIIRTWQTADKMKQQRGRLPDEKRRQRQCARQALHRQIHDQSRHRAWHRRKHVGSVEKGKLADLVLWSPAFFGVKPDLVLKGGIIAAAPMGDPNASIPTPQPVHYRPMFGAFGAPRTAASVRVRLEGRRCDAGIGAQARLARPLVAVANTRGGIPRRA